ncbi:MurR/RpiR family transcriptional regulator [Neptuniibacter halophilus]|uniref:MurR/RpiR family transcriptional regulator n=1 Tax=Neptuniibacter halophilus TaxID=651666 RepID=UPI002572EB90|nr:MurR/RpiR family transcriptional regulator [Neptuniibacter halophilus]
MQPETKQPDTADELLKHLSSLYPELTPQLKKAADFVLENPVELALLTIRKSADSADVTASTMMRLVKTLGFDSYEPFRQLFQDAVQNQAPITFGNRAQSLQELASSAPGNRIFTEMAESALQGLEQLFQESTLEQIKSAAPLIVNAPRVYVLGFRDTFACAYHFAYSGRIAFPQIQLLRGMEGTLLSELAMITEEDTVLLFGSSPYSSESVSSAEIVRSSGARLISVTDSLRSPLVADAEVVFTVRHDSPHYFPSIMAPILLIEALLAECVSISGKERVENITRFEESLRKLGGYHNG